MSQENALRDAFQEPNSDDDLCISAAERMDFDCALNDGQDRLFINLPEEGNAYRLQIAAFQEPHSDDLLCISAAERADFDCALNDGQDRLFINLPEESNVPQPQIIAPGTSFRTPAETNNVNWSNEATARINIVHSQSPLARIYLEDSFYRFEQWPAYMVELFVLNSIQNYSYAMRNKICLFFWGNGATYEIMSKLSTFYAPKALLRTREEQYQFNASHRKCEDLFKTYREQLHNPSYSGKYYYYNIHTGRMLYIDNRPRHYGIRQEEPYLDRFPSWF